MEKKIISFSEIKETVVKTEVDDSKMAQLNLIDAAAKGNIEAAEKLAIGYFNGEFGEKNTAKAKKWATYASKHGSKAAKELLDKI